MKLRKYDEIRKMINDWQSNYNYVSGFTGLKISFLLQEHNINYYISICIYDRNNGITMKEHVDIYLSDSVELVQRRIDKEIYFMEKTINVKRKELLKPNCVLPTGTNKTELRAQIREEEINYIIDEIRTVMIKKLEKIRNKIR